LEAEVFSKTVEASVAPRARHVDSTVQEAAWMIAWSSSFVLGEGCGRDWGALTFFTD
jgi:hypothetical protein